MPYLDESGNPVAALNFIACTNGDTRLVVTLARGANNLPVVDAAFAVLEEIEGRLVVSGDGGDDGGREDVAPPSAVEPPAAQQTPNEEDGVIYVPLDDTPPAEGVVIQ